MTPSEPGDKIDDAAPTESPYAGTMDAIVTGITDGLRFIVEHRRDPDGLVALVALVNYILGLFPDMGGAALSLERLLGLALASLAWLIGIPWSEAVVAGGLIGTKIVLNELITYFQLSGLPEGVLSERSRIILLYALCSF